MLEVAVSRSSSELNIGAGFGKRQSYVRAVLGIKLYDKLATRNPEGQRSCDEGISNILLSKYFNYYLILYLNFKY
jgi:hypothetical protein